MHRIDTPPSSQRQVPAFFRTPARVLLAEDDPEMREMIAGVLRGDGYEVADVADGGRLLVRIADAYASGHAHDAFDLLVSDVRMPVCTGLEVLEGLRKARWGTPAILMTAFGDDAIRKRAQSLDAVLFDKPFDVDDLRTIALNLILGSAARPRTPRAPIAFEDDQEEDTDVWAR